jgi:ATP-dependent Clp protease ATP-binding subunit ClpC
MLKPALARGELQCVGASTLNEYRKYIEKDGALERRFQTIMVEPPSKAETIEILKGLRERYENHHRVKYTDSALEGAIELSSRYITGRFLPDKAIDVIDEAGSRVRLKAMSQPPDLRDIEEEIRGLERKKDDSVARQDFEAAASLRDDAYRLRKKKENKQKDWLETAKVVNDVVDEDIIAETVSNMTGIPLTRLEKGEAERLLNLEDELHRNVVSQEEAVRAISKAIRRSRSGLKDPRRPIGSFIFLGPTGVGKTHLAKSLARVMFGAEDALIHVDMSEYMEKHNVSRLVGAPPGYVGYEEGGQLTEKIRRRPYAVVLLDEIEKAHSDVFNMLLQIMEEGRLTDSFGRNIDFRNTVLIMTSNIGAEVAKNQSALGFHKGTADVTFEKMKGMLNKEVERHFRPEFINRIDEIIVFKGLDKEDLKKIVDIELIDVMSRLRAKSVELTVTDQAKEHIVETGYNPDFGARPIKRNIEKLLEDPLSEAILRGEFEGMHHLKVRVRDGGIVFDASENEEKAETSSAK